MKKVVALLAFALLISFLWASPVKAHVIKTDGSMTVLLHINPDDKPVAGSPQSFILYFQSNTLPFDLHNCNCRLDLIKDGQIIYSQAATYYQPTISQNPYTFVNDGVYTLNVSGNPINNAQFQAFKASYLIRVEPSLDPPKESSTKDYLILVLFLLQIPIVITLYYYGNKRSGKGAKKE